MFILIDEKKKLSTQPKDKTDKQINKQTNNYQLFTNEYGSGRTQNAVKELSL